MVHMLFAIQELASDDELRFGDHARPTCSEPAGFPRELGVAIALCKAKKNRCRTNGTSGLPARVSTLIYWTCARPEALERRAFISGLRHNLSGSLAQAFVDSRNDSSIFNARHSTVHNRVSRFKRTAFLLKSVSRMKTDSLIPFHFVNRGIVNSHP